MVKFIQYQKKMKRLKSLKKVNRFERDKQLLATSNASYYILVNKTHPSIEILENTHRIVLPYPWYILKCLVYIGVNKLTVKFSFKIAMDFKTKMISYMQLT